MTAKSTKSSDAAQPPVDEAADDHLDEQYEEEIKELVERLVRRGRPKPARPKPEAEAEAQEPEASAAEAAEDEVSEADAPEAGAAKDEVTEAKASRAEAGKAKGGAPEAKAEAGDEEAAETSEGGLRQQVQRLTVINIVLASALAVAVAAAGTLAFFLSRSADDQSARRQVAQRAGLIATTLFNYDYRHIDGYPARQTSVMSSSLAASAKKGKAAMLDMITKGQLVWNAKVNQVYVGDVHGDTAWAIVDSDAKVVSSKIIATLTGTVTRFKLVKEHGVWLLAQAPETLSQGTETDTDLQGNPLPATPAPSTSPTSSPAPAK